MFWHYCTACFRGDELTRVGPLLFLCGLCRDELCDLSLPCGPGRRAATCLYRYDGLVRRLILRAKVEGDQRALALLVGIAAAHPTAQAMAGWADALIWAPASLWGRLRGRLDLAAHLALQLGEHARRPVLAAPAHLHWRWRKQALKPRRDRTPPRPLPAGLQARGRRRFAHQLDRALSAHPAAGTSADPGEVSEARLLLVDDVVTSGATLDALAAVVAASVGGPVLRRLTLATARR